MWRCLGLELLRRHKEAVWSLGFWDAFNYLDGRWWNRPGLGAILGSLLCTLAAWFFSLIAPGY